MYRGAVKFFNVKSKFGFITEENTKTDYYFYVKNITIIFETGNRVSFDLKNGKKGIEAVNVTLVKSDISY